MQHAVRNNMIIISVLNESNQECLIQNTLSCQKETDVINKYLREDKNIKIVLYGENCSDEKLIKKCQQLYGLGFPNIYVYIGGLFEWLLLQDIFGCEQFPTTKNITNILLYQGNSFF